MSVTHSVAHLTRAESVVERRSKWRTAPIARRARGYIRAIEAGERARSEYNRGEGGDSRVPFSLQEQQVPLPTTQSNGGTRVFRLIEKFC